MQRLLNLLYVEDSEGDLEMMEASFARYLVNIKLEIDFARTISEGEEVCFSKAYDAVIIDWNLPDGLGTDLAIYIRKKNKEMPILFLSGLLTEEMIVQAEAYSPMSCLEKDYSKETIEKIIRLIQEMSNSSSS